MDLRLCANALCLRYQLYLFPGRVKKAGNKCGKEAWTIIHDLPGEAGQQLQCQGQLRMDVT